MNDHISKNILKLTGQITCNHTPALSVLSELPCRNRRCAGSPAEHCLHILANHFLLEGAVKHTDLRSPHCLCKCCRCLSMMCSSRRQRIVRVNLACGVQTAIYLNRIPGVVLSPDPSQILVLVDRVVYGCANWVEGPSAAQHGSHLGRRLPSCSRVKFLRVGTLRDMCKELHDQTGAKPVRKTRVVEVVHELKRVTASATLAQFRKAAGFTHDVMVMLL